MNGRDQRGRFTKRNPYASQGGRARAAALPAERRREIAAAGFAAFVAQRFSGDRTRAVAWLGKLGAWVSDVPYRDVFPVFEHPGPCPNGRSSQNGGKMGL